MKTDPTQTQTQKSGLMAKIAMAFGFMLLIGGSAMAQVTTTDSVCASSQDVVYGITGASATSTYTWVLGTPAAGTIDNSVTPNGSEIQIDWGATSGTYTLIAYETTGDGCLGDSVELDIVINDLPTVAMVADSVCEGFANNVTFTLTGKAPWIIDFTVDGTPTSTTASSSPHTFTLPVAATTQALAVTGVTDGNSCDADASGYPTGNATVFPKPTTGAIYHY